MRGPHLPFWLFLASVTSSSSTTPLLYGWRKMYRLATLTQIMLASTFPPVPMHLPPFLAHASAISPSCLKAKAQSLCPPAEAVPISADGSISIMGITKSLFATH